MFNKFSTPSILNLAHRSLVTAFYFQKVLQAGAKNTILQGLEILNVATKGLMLKALIEIA